MTQKNQGEGNRDAAEEYNDATRDFVETGKVEKNENKHMNLSDEEKKDIQEAEEKGKEKAKK
ncbi:hypothetical protein [Nitrosomonas supralitoralis]|uniref:Uncharacterized protein n=1 Tax=Nitrosomonas supralitoralis TaxID=2116706 RepID=A0A2P7NSM2_9PROT|nr:hypothetical protein [Nitrosomonas supralitoralis]PSJ16473.1 hypothetical protein C7H79_13275 [Nitrosomonas supralitoralis]